MEKKKLFLKNFYKMCGSRVGASPLSKIALPAYHSFLAKMATLNYTS